MKTRNGSALEQLLDSESSGAAREPGAMTLNPNDKN